MFRRQEKTSPTPDAPPAAHPVREGAKNRPTPKRRDQEKSRRQPLIVTDRKAAREADRARRREAMIERRAAMARGDDSALPARDQGPVKRYIRQFVDARWNIAEFLLPMMLIILALQLFKTLWAINLQIVLMWSLIAITVVDSFFMWRKLKAQLLEKFGAAKMGKGNLMYALMRSSQIRRTRIPRPTTARGEYPS